MKRKEKIVTGEYYHIFNRGVEKRNIFKTKKDYQHFLDSMIFFNTEKPSWKIGKKFEDRPRIEERLVDIVAYCLNPNHFHLLLRENKENGIAIFMKKICTGHAMYFNKKTDRSGVLFQGRYKSVHIFSNDLLLYISVYVNCNSQIHAIEDASVYPWCSFSEYSGISTGIDCQKSIVLEQFKNNKGYINFCIEKSGGMKEKKDMEKIYLED